MEPDRPPERLSFLDGPLPSRFRLFEVTLAPGGSRAYDEAEWSDALVVVERGEIELECTAGVRRRFPGGAVMWLEGIGVRTLYNPGTEPTVLVAVSRRLRA